MNDPQVETLIYRVRHHESIDYSNVDPLSYDHDDFRVDVKDEEARFELKLHFATEQGARQVVNPFVRDWVFDARFAVAPAAYHWQVARKLCADARSVAENIQQCRLSA